MVGFVVLVFSAFRPNAYFGLFTGFAMVAALFAMLTLLPVLIQLLDPFSAARKEGEQRAQERASAAPDAGTKDAEADASAAPATESDEGPRAPESDEGPRSSEPEPGVQP